MNNKTSGARGGGGGGGGGGGLPPNPVKLRAEKKKKIGQKGGLQPGLPRYIVICDISRYFLYIAQIFFGHIAIQTYIDIRRIDGERRKYTKFIQQMQLVLGHVHVHSNSAVVLRTVNYPPPSKYKLAARVSIRVTANA